MVELKPAIDPAGNSLYVIQMTDAGQVCNLAANTDTSFTVPADARLCIFGYSSANDYWVAKVAITKPSSSTPANTNYLLNPPTLVVAAGETVHVLATAEAGISLAFYK